MVFLWQSRMMFLILAAAQASARQPAELFDTFQTFLSMLLDPAAIAASGNSSVLAADCIGRVNGVWTLTGRQNNTEFLFGISSSTAQSNTTQLIGYPIDVAVESLSIQLSVLAASAVFSIYYSTLQAAVPVQVDMWLVFTEDLQISSYDFNARRFADALNFVQPKLAPLIALEMKVTGNTDNTTNVVMQKAAKDICQAAATSCTRSNEQYSSYESCYEHMSTVAFDSNIQICRYLEKELVSTRPDVHCSSLGPTGGSICASQDYAKLVAAYPFKKSLVAANVSAPGISQLSDGTQLELMKLNMEQYYSTTVGFYAAPTLLFFFFLYVSGRATDFTLNRYSSVFPTLSFENRRNTVTYAMNAFYTTVVFIIQMVCSPMLAEKYSGERVAELRSGVTVITCLYLFELIYRPNMRWPLLIHHICTIFAITFLVIAVDISLDPATFAAGIIWTFQATTEQSIFIALFLYRLKYPKKLLQPLLKFAAVQSFICKVAFAVYLMVWWGLKLAKFHTPIDICVSFVVVTITLILMSTQVHGSWAVWCIAVNMNHHPSPAPEAKGPGPAVLPYITTPFDFELAHNRNSSSQQYHETDSLLSQPVRQTIPLSSAGTQFQDLRRGRDYSYSGWTPVFSNEDETTFRGGSLPSSVG